MTVSAKIQRERSEYCPFTRQCNSCLGSVVFYFHSLA